jgi:hypothetical protein
VKRRLSLLFAAGLLAATAAAVALAALTPKQYRQQATVICVRAHRQINALPNARTRAQMIRIFEAVVPIERSYDAGFASLHPPATIKPTHEALLALHAKSFALDERILATLKATSGTANFTSAMSQWSTATDKLNRHENVLLRRLQLPKCL